MDPVTWIAIAVAIAAGAGFGAGWGLRPVPDSSDLLEAQAATLDALTDGQTELAEVMTRPVVIDAEIRDQLAQVPPQCRTGQDPSGLACAWATCLQYGQSSAQRPECRAIEAAYLASVACSEPTP